MTQEAIQEIIRKQRNYFYTGATLNIDFTTISYLLLPLGLKYLKTTLVAIYGYLILIVATVTSFVLGQDRFSWTQLAAIVLICASVYLVEVAESNKQITSKLK